MAIPTELDGEDVIAGVVESFLRLCFMVVPPISVSLIVELLYNILWCWSGVPLATYVRLCDLARTSSSLGTARPVIRSSLRTARFLCSWKNRSVEVGINSRYYYEWHLTVPGPMSLETWLLCKDRKGKVNERGWLVGTAASPGKHKKHKKKAVTRRKERSVRCIGYTE